MNTTNHADAGKNLLWPGATPHFDASIAPKSLRASGVAPGHGMFASLANLKVSRVRIRANSCPSRSTLTCATQVQPRRTRASTKTT